MIIQFMSLDMVYDSGRDLKRSLGLLFEISPRFVVVGECCRLDCRRNKVNPLSQVSS
jgi:hypothetical protein